MVENVLTGGCRRGAGQPGWGLISHAFPEGWVGAALGQDGSLQ